MDLRAHKAPPIPTSAANQLFDSFPWQIVRFVLLPIRFPVEKDHTKQSQNAIVELLVLPQ
jgi:hypothetical protein